MGQNHLLVLFTLTLIAVSTAQSEGLLKKAHRRVPCEPENENLCGFLLLNHDLTNGAVAHADDVHTLAG